MDLGLLRKAWLAIGFLCVFFLIQSCQNKRKLLSADNDLNSVYSTIKNSEFISARLISKANTVNFSNSNLSNYKTDTVFIQQEDSIFVSKSLSKIYFRDKIFQVNLFYPVKAANYLKVGTGNLFDYYNIFQLLNYYDEYAISFTKKSDSTGIVFIIKLPTNNKLNYDIVTLHLNNGRSQFPLSKIEYKLSSGSLKFQNYNEVNTIIEIVNVCLKKSECQKTFSVSPGDYYKYEDGIFSLKGKYEDFKINPVHILPKGN